MIDTVVLFFSKRRRNKGEKHLTLYGCVWACERKREKKRDFFLFWQHLGSFFLFSGGIALITVPACRVGADSVEPGTGRRSFLLGLQSRVSIRPGRGHGSLRRLPHGHGLFLGRRLLLGLPAGRHRGLRGDAVRPLQGQTAGVVLAKVLVEDGLEREAFAAHVAVERLVARVLADVILQLILAGVLLPAHAAHKRCDAHVQAHVPVQAALLVEGFGAVNAREPRVVPEPALRNLLLPQVFHVSAHSQHG